MRTYEGNQYVVACHSTSPSKIELFLLIVLEHEQELKHTLPPEGVFHYLSREPTIAIIFAPNQMNPWQISFIKKFVQIL
jgi:hypothetical protein